MIYTFFSDIHANLPALNQALEKAEGQLIVLGDSVGYGASPLECLEILKTLKPLRVIGNHDDYCVGNKVLGIIPHAEAKMVLDWTRKQLENEDLEFLAAGAEMSVDDMALTHMLHVPAENYFFQTKKISQLESHRLLFVGHTHKPYICEIDISGRKIKMIKSPKDKFALEEGKKYIVNVGSVGQPRDGDPRLSLVKFFQDKEQIVFLREEYDMNAAQKKILQEQLPERFALRLARGM
jgi:predicted phosphodiesterase